MSEPNEQLVREAADSFQSFVIMQIIGAWFADAPDSAALIDETMSAWRARMKKLFEARAKHRYEQTGVVTNPDEFEGIADEAEKRIRAGLARQMKDAPGASDKHQVASKPN